VLSFDPLRCPKLARRVAAGDGRRLEKCKFSDGSAGNDPQAGLRPKSRSHGAMPHGRKALRAGQARHHLYLLSGRTGAFPRADHRDWTQAAPEAGRTATSRCVGSELAADRQLRRRSTDRSPGPGMITLIRHGLDAPAPNTAPDGPLSPKGPTGPSRQMRSARSCGLPICAGSGRGLSCQGSVKPATSASANGRNSNASKICYAAAVLPQGYRYPQASADPPALGTPRGEPSR
jgi:hypothetical protein